MSKSLKSEKFVVCRDINNQKAKYPLSKLKWRPSVYGVIVENNKILLSKQWDGYDFPGGGINLGETLEEALKREVREETGAEIKILDLLACEMDFFKLPYTNKCIQSVLVYYLCRKTGGKISKDGLDQYEKKYADLPEWISLDEAKKAKFYNSVDSIKLIKKALNLCPKQ